MSHFSVLVRVSGETPRDKIEDAVGELLEPYCEHDDEGRSAKYMVFKDQTAEHREEYETKAMCLVALPGGKRVPQWSNEAVQAARLASGRPGLGAFDRVDPADVFPKVDVPFKDVYPSFETFAKEWHGDSPNADGRYGYNHNPNAKWDYWRVGGRWRGDLLVRRTEDAGLGPLAWEHTFDKDRADPIPGDEGAGEVDFCRVADLDWDRIATLARERADKFWSEVDAFLAGKDYAYGDGPRYALLDLGILDCKSAGEFDRNTVFWCKPWGRDDRFDVIASKIDRETLGPLVQRYMNPVCPYSYVDADGWHAPGRVGWFGSSSATGESMDAYAREFEERVRSGNLRDWLVMVDCHI